MWLVFALLSPLFWAIVHVLDAHCVERVFERPWMGVITSALASLVVVVAIPFAPPIASWHVSSIQIVILALAAGALIQLSQAFYFQALEYSEAGIVAAYWNLTPALLPVASVLLLQKALGGWQYVGIAILIVASVSFYLLDTSFSARWRSFLLMLVASCLQVGAILIEKYVFERSSFFVGFLLITTGIVVSGTVPLLLPRVRTAFRQNIEELRAAVPLIVGIEIANLVALFMSQRAISLGIPSLVAAVEATIPAYTFALAMLIVIVTKGRFGDPRGRQRLPLKLSLVGVMAVGVALLSDG